MRATTRQPRTPKARVPSPLPRKGEPSFSNLPKVLYPSGFTKGDAIDYYRRVAPAMLPHLGGRAVTLKRYPNGSRAPFFFEKNCPAHRPFWVRTAHVDSAHRESEGVDFCVLDDRASLLWVANLAALELHVPLGKADAPSRPTAMVFDLDPGAPATLADCARLGLELRDVLDRLGLQSFAKTSGSKGLHVYVPLNQPRLTFDDTKTFALAVASLFERRNPASVTVNMSKAGRAGKVFMDWSQNDRHKTTVCAYSLRAGGDRPGVSTPVTWAELEKALRRDALPALAFTPQQVLDRVTRLGDLFAPVTSLKQRLPSP